MNSVTRTSMPPGGTGLQTKHALQRALRPKVEMYVLCMYVYIYIYVYIYACLFICLFIYG